MSYYILELHHSCNQTSLILGLMKLVIKLKKKFPLHIANDLI